MSEYKFRLGQTVIWRGSWGTDFPRLAVIVELAEKNDQPVYDLDNGHWAYEHQLSEVPVENRA